MSPQQAPQNLVLLECPACAHQVSVPVISTFVDDAGTPHVAICPMQACPTCKCNAWEIAEEQLTHEQRVALWDPQYH